MRVLDLDPDRRRPRVADPGWRDPVDPGWAAAAGGRWNPVGLGCLYLNDDVDTARANARRGFAGRFVQVEDLRPERQPVLVEVIVAAERGVDAVSGDGLASVGLPPSYPLDEHGQIVVHDRCQRVGRDAAGAGLDGVLARSAATREGRGRELAWFPAGRRARVVGPSIPFEHWYWPGRPR